MEINFSIRILRISIQFNLIVIIIIYNDIKIVYLLSQILISPLSAPEATRLELDLHQEITLTSTS